MLRSKVLAGIGYVWLYSIQKVKIKLDICHLFGGYFMEKTANVSSESIFEEIQENFKNVGTFPVLKHRQGKVEGVEEIEGKDNNGCIDVVTFDHKTHKVSMYDVNFEPPSSMLLNIINEFLEVEKKMLEKRLEGVNALRSRLYFAQQAALEREEKQENG